MYYDTSRAERHSGRRGDDGNESVVSSQLEDRKMCQPCRDVLNEEEGKFQTELTHIRRQVRIVEDEEVMVPMMI